jgi:hypothetical protein
MAQLEERMARIEGALSQLDKRLTEWINHFSNEIGQLRNEMSNEIGQLRSEIRQMRSWMIGILIPMWVTIILAILATIFIVLFKGG